ncbi:hypothetical protein PISL3812_06850 [Talaromyces islandicus]|uniref:Ribosomal RNA-processing protein 17 n=1 Tax=Talaromyces islandicus TaxID=28573 RepID=A0A0U1M468_TALIS|nr:hypothetical protein PISL3812_06850 [Talaromyces islandicus]
MGPQAKRRKVASAVEEISFDPTARHDFLTGFHKRKQQRIKLAQEYAEKKAREDKREERKKIRENRTAEIQQALDESRKMLQQARGSVSGSESDSESEDEWEGFEEPIPVDHEAEYIDEDKYTTVTVEEMGTTRDDLRSNKEYSPAGDEVDHKTTTNSSTGKNDKPVKPRQKVNSEKKRKKKFRYESKAERKLTQRKERMSNRKHARSRQES